MTVKPIVVLLSTLVSVLPVHQLSQAQQTRLTWQNFRAMPGNQKAEYIDFFPAEFPKDFANGQLAFTRLHTGGSAYIVAQEKAALPNLSTVRQQIGKNVLFNAASVEGSLPALAAFPERLYKANKVVEVIHWAPRYDGQMLRDQARSARRESLSNQKFAYYLKQDTNRQGWCTFADESARYSDFLCVNMANSPQIALTTLRSIINRHPNFHQ